MLRSKCFQDGRLVCFMCFLVNLCLLPVLVSSCDKDHIGDDKIKENESAQNQRVLSKYKLLIKIYNDCLNS